MVDKIERHNFEALQALAWRNSDLDFSNVEALLDSLAAPAPQPGLAKGHDATDHITLSMLARDAEIRGLAATRGRVRLLWEACQIPDFRKLSDDSHAAVCSRVFRHIAEDGVLPDEWVLSQIALCGGTEGDLDTLMARLANIRVWSYVAARSDWLKDAANVQGEARKAEDAVSDALHERLTARFVDRRAAHLIRRLDDTEDELLSAVTRQGQVVVEGHPVGRVEGFLFHPETEGGTEDEKKLVLRAARRALKEEMPRRVAALDMAKDDAFTLTASHRISWNNGATIAEVARLRPGSEPGKPLVEPLPSEFLDGAQRERVRARLAKFVEGLINKELGILATIEGKAEAEGSLRGPAFLLREQLGLALGGTEGNIAPDLRQKLKAIGVRAGRFALFVPEALKPRAMALRAQLWSMSRNIETPTLPPPGLVALQIREPAEGEAALPPGSPPPAGWPTGFAETMGWIPAGPVLLRLDVAERIAAELGYLTRRAPAPPPPDLASRLGVKADTLGVTLAALGFRLMEAPPLEEGMYGPPTPLRVAQPRPQHHQPRGPERRPGGRPTPGHRRPGRAAARPPAAAGGCPPPRPHGPPDAPMARRVPRAERQRQDRPRPAPREAAPALPRADGRAAASGARRAPPAARQAGAAAAGPPPQRRGRARKGPAAAPAGRTAATSRGPRPPYEGNRRRLRPGREPGPAALPGADPRTARAAQAARAADQPGFALRHPGQPQAAVSLGGGDGRPRLAAARQVAVVRPGRQDPGRLCPAGRDRRGPGQPAADRQAAFQAAPGRCADLRPGRAGPRGGAGLAGGRPRRPARPGHRGAGVIRGHCERVPSA